MSEENQLIIPPIEKEQLQGEKFIISFEQYKPVLIKHPESKKIYQDNKIHLNYYQLLTDTNDGWKELKFDAVLQEDGVAKIQDVYIDNEILSESIVYGYLAKGHENFFAKCVLPEYTDIKVEELEHEQ